MPNQTTILVVDDEPATLKYVGANLKARNYQVRTANDGLEAIRMCQEKQPDLMILDIGLPGLDGFEVCAAIRRRYPLPILVLSAHGRQKDIIRALELGADDYIIKPFDPSEVVARIRARIRKDRAQAEPGNLAKFADWAADFDRYSLIDIQGEETPFSHAEGEVLRLFLESPKRLISRAFMQERLGGAAGESFDRAMDVRISRLRTKLKEDPKNPQLIKTIYGAGYIFLGDVSWDR